MSVFGFKSIHNFNESSNNEPKKNFIFLFFTHISESESIQRKFPENSLQSNICMHEILSECKDLLNKQSKLG